MHTKTTSSRPPGRLARLLLSLLVVTGATATTQAVLAAPAHADSFVYTVTNYDGDGTHGVYLRNSSNVDDVTRDGAHYLLYGTTVQLLCAEFGSSVGSHANTAWDYVRVLSGPNTGRTGHLSEHWLNTPVSSNQHVSGEPSCTPAPQPAPQPTPPSASGAEAAAVNWARAHLGSSSWNGLCLSFVRQAWAAGGVDLRRKVAVAWGSNTYPYDVWPRITSGAKGSGQPTTPGSLVFYYGNTGYTRTHSHVSIYVGGGRLISVDDYVAGRVHYESFGQHGRELGWWLPG